MGFKVTLEYFDWYYRGQARGMIKAWKNFLRFNLNYFSIPLLFKTLFSPWHKYQWFYGKGFELGERLQVFLSNLISRLFGAAIRLSFILVGVLVEIFIVLVGIAAIIFWLVMPALLVMGLWFGFKALF